MAEYIERQKVFDALPTVKEDRQISLYGAVADFMVIVSAVPACDVIAVIRCKECRFYGVDRNKRGFCMRPWSPSMWRDETGELKPDDYCSYAIRKERT